MSSESSQPVRFHISLNVSDLAKSVQFFKTLFGKEPAKQRDDYAKFELSDPPLVMSLEPHTPAGRGALNHVGFRFPDSAALVEAQKRLELAGMHTEREEGVECCYARQTKFWVNDPDGGLWEFYTLEEDIDHRGAGQSVEKVHAHVPVIEPTTIWEHRLGQAFEAPAAASCDEVRLRGTFNMPHSDDEARRMLREAYAALRPGGKLMVHTLTAETPFIGVPKLPGPAQYVGYVPVRQALLNALESAGFTGLYLLKFGSNPCFIADGIEMRETMITGCKPAPEGTETRCVLYKGPFATVSDDEGRSYVRGEPTAISETQWAALSKSAIGEHFVSMPSPEVVALA
jgi:catechol 2,3-dioxygenase-like lactoylglutathione lyase family enzyme